MNRITAASIAALCGLTAACAKKEAPVDTTAAAPAAAVPAAAPAPAPPAAPMATVNIVSPAEGDSTAPDVKVVLSASNVTIAKVAPKADGVGHYHLFLDTIPVADGVVIPPNSKHIAHIGTGDSTYTFKGLAPGAHEIIAVIGYGDHTAMPEKRDTVHFVVKKK